MIRCCRAAAAVRREAAASCSSCFSSFFWEEAVYATWYTIIKPLDFFLNPVDVNTLVQWWWKRPLWCWESPSPVNFSAVTNIDPLALRVFPALNLMFQDHLSPSRQQQFGCSYFSLISNKQVDIFHLIFCFWCSQTFWNKYPFQMFNIDGEGVKFEGGQKTEKRRKKCFFELTPFQCSCCHRPPTFRAARRRCFLALAPRKHIDWWSWDRRGWRDGWARSHNWNICVAAAAQGYRTVVISADYHPPLESSPPSPHFCLKSACWLHLQAKFRGLLSRRVNKAAAEEPSGTERATKCNWIIIHPHCLLVVFPLPRCSQFKINK